MHNESDIQLYTELISVSFAMLKGASEKTDSKFQIPVSTWTAPVCDEDWDEGKTLTHILRYSHHEIKIDTTFFYGLLPYLLLLIYPCTS